MGLLVSLFRFFFYPEENGSEELDTSQRTASRITKDLKSEERVGDDRTVSPVQSRSLGAKENSGCALESQSPGQLQEIKEVGSMNIIVKYRGKKKTIDMFPLERISALKDYACQQAQIRASNYKLVYEGQIMEEDKTIHDYSLRGGREVSLICVK